MMKKLIICAVTVMAIGIMGCNQLANPKSSTTASEQSSTTTPGGTPSTPSNSISLTETDLFTAFGLTKGSITASAAAKRIETGTPTGSSITFTEKKYTAYDDQAGTFTVEVKGTKDGKNFSQKISVTGFTHPLAGKTIQSVASCELNFDDAIEYNYSLKKYIEEVNKDPSGIKLLKKLSFLLNDGTTTITLGVHDGYTLTAKAKDAGTQVLVQPSVMFRKLAEGGTEELVKNTNFGFTHLKSQLTKDYFTGTDVFKYVLDKTVDADAIKVDSNEFPSSFYAGAKQTEQTPGNLFSDEFTAAIKNYADRYKDEGSDKNLKLDISYGIVQPANGGVKANDYTGTITANICIATNTQIQDQSGITAMKRIEKSGFAKISNEEELKKHILFAITFKHRNPSQADIEKWKNKRFDNYKLFSVSETGQGSPNPLINPLPDGEDKPFCLCVNGQSELATQLGCENFGASRTMHGKTILIEHISLKKDAGNPELQVQVQLKGTNFTIKTNPLDT